MEGLGDQKVHFCWSNGEEGPGVPQQGAWEQLCLLQLFKHSASSLKVCSACIHTFNIQFSCIWVMLIDASIHLHINLPLPVS